VHAEPLGLRGAQVGNLCPRELSLKINGDGLQNPGPKMAASAICLAQIIYMLVDSVIRDCIVDVRGGVT